MFQLFLTTGNPYVQKFEDLIGLWALDNSMAIYRWEGKQFRQLKSKRSGEERDLKNLLEQDTTFFLGERVRVIRRQPPVDASKRKLELLALNQKGNCVVIKLGLSVKLLAQLSHRCLEARLGSR